MAPKAKLDFAGDGLVLTSAGLSAVCDRLDVYAAEVWAVLKVETAGFGFLPDKRPMILYERHIFHRQTGGKHSAKHPDISNDEPGGYGAGGAHQYDRLQKAIALDRRAALNATSWGVGQLMGFNAKMAGFGDVEGMVEAMSHAEDDQLLGMAGEIQRAGLAKALANHDWATFARGYNGKNYAINHYDVRLKQAYDHYAAGPLPDLAVREAQACLLYCGYIARGVDGVMGKFTRSAISQFQAAEKLKVTGELDDKTMERLRAKAGF
ncbi:MAG: N-acetylmuramidase domain-containing protein [Alphaproteobacteria bacterium]|nr:N-acetylmuramidase domain-containing protein [Alphaproteobacteria bacterium]